MQIQLFYNQFQVIQRLLVYQDILLSKMVFVGKTFDHRHLPDPIYEQIKHLERQLEKTRNGEIQDDYII